MSEQSPDHGFFTRLDERADRWPFLDSPMAGSLIFFTFFLAGFVFIIWGKLISLPAPVVTFVPVVLMLAYAALLGFARRLRLRDDQAGDNLYYLGFLFTLTSLGVTLYQFTGSGGAQQIVQNFGIAIASTIAGVALRIFFNQMRRDPIEVEATARLELAEAANRVRRQLDNSTLEFNQFRRTLQQVIFDSFDLTQKKVDEVSARILANLEDAATKSTRPLQEAAQRNSKILDDWASRSKTAQEKSSASIVQTSEQLTGGIEAAIASLTLLTGKLRDMQTPEQVIEIKLNPAIQGLSRAVTNFSKEAQAQIERQAKFQQETGKVTGVVVAELEKSLTSFNATLARMMAETQNSIGTLRTDVSGIQRKLDEQHLANGKALSATQDVSERYGRRIEELVASLKATERLGDLAHELEAARQQSATPVSGRGPAI